MCPTGRNSPNFWRGELRHWCDKQYQGHPSGKDGRRQPEGVCHPVHQLLPRADCDRDIHFSGEITVDREKARCYTVCDGDYLPDRTVRSDVEDTTLPVSGCSLYMAELEGLGVHLHCNHAVNQILYFEGSEKLYEEFSRRVAVYRTNKGMGQGHAGAEGGRAREHAEGDHGGEAAPLPCQFFRHDMG